MSVVLGGRSPAGAIDVSPLKTMEAILLECLMWHFYGLGRSNSIGRISLVARDCARSLEVGGWHTRSVESGAVAQIAPGPSGGVRSDMGPGSGGFK